MTGKPLSDGPGQILTLDHLPEEVQPAGLNAAIADALPTVQVDGFNQAAIDAAYAAIVASGGGTLVFPPGAYTGALNIHDNIKITVAGFGATLKAAANGATLVRISQGWGNTILGAAVHGLILDGNGHTGVTGLAFESTDGATARDLFIKSCATGVTFHNVAAGSWTERCALTDTFITTCTTGISFIKEAAARDSFNETGLFNVGINAETTCMYVGPAANMVRSTFDNVTLWLGGANQTALKLDGPYMRHTRWNIGIEALPEATAATGVHIASALLGGQPDSNFYELSFVGTFTNQILDTPGGTDFAWKQGHAFYRLNGNSSGVKLQQYGEPFPRLQMYPGANGSIAFGDGQRSPNNLLSVVFGSGATQRMDWTGSLVAAKGVGVFGTAPPGAKPTVTGSRGGNAALASLLTTLASYGLITDSTTA